ncbi:MAG: alpha/beta fold hydrolase [Myxococcales bacterium]|nr:alpha/beta fold hydrolase [Myxococcales bacterium]
MAERIEFTGSHGDRLAARLDRASGKPRAYAIFAHCFTCSKDIAAASRVSRALADEGISVLRFDFTGLGHSDGEFANTNFSSNVEDLGRAADWLREQHEAPSLLVGHSLGGAAVLAAAGQIPEVRAVATVAAPFDPAHIKKLFANREAEIETQGEVEVELAGRPFTIRRQLLDDIGAQNLEERIRELRRPMLILHAPTDLIVGIENASRIFQAARHPKSFISLDGADHLLTRREDAAYTAQVIAAWAHRYLPPRPAVVQAGADQNEVVVVETGETPFSQSIAAGPHLLRADEPPSVGGEDSGPTPYGLLLASLGACTSMTLRMYANRKKLPLQRVTVRLRHEKIHAKDCEECETQAGRIDHIDTEIRLDGDLDETQRERLLEIASRCPIHRTLHSEVAIRSRLV